MRGLIAILIVLSLGMSDAGAAAADQGCSTTATPTRYGEVRVDACTNWTTLGADAITGVPRPQLNCPPVPPGYSFNYTGDLGCHDGTGLTWIHCAAMNYWGFFIGTEVRNGISGSLWSYPAGSCWLPDGAPGVPPMAAIIEAVRRVPLPPLTAHVQPETRTLVNADTIVYTTPAPFDTTVVILGETVHIHAIPATYTWHFGDGTTTTTTTPGAPWPHDTISHRYQHADDHVPLSVTVSYDVTYNTNGAPWQPLDSPIDTPGPTTTITVTEARAVLVAP